MRGFVLGALQSDVCVIGGGPAGASVAAQLARLGRHVVLVEAAPFPRHKVPAALPSSVLPLLGALGVRDAIDGADFVRSRPPMIRWAHGESQGDPKLWVDGLHVDRGRFDQILISHAARHGARIIQPARVRAARRRRESEGWGVVVQDSQSTTEITTRVLIDASGRGVMCRRKLATGAPLVAMYAYLSRPASDELPSRVVAGESEWLWFAPASRDSCICEVFLHPKRLAGLNGSQRLGLFRQLLANDGHIARWMAHADFGSLQIQDATSRTGPWHAEADYLSVGDASFTIDPLSSQGVQVAIASALQAAAVANTMIDGGSDAQIAAMFYVERQQARLALHAARTSIAYRQVARSRGTAFWRERADCAVPVARSQATASPRQDGRGRLSRECVLRLQPDVRFEDRAAIRHNRVVSMPAVCSAGLAEPVVFLHGIFLAELLRTTVFDRPAAAVADDWQRRVPGNWAWTALEWLWNCRVVGPAEPGRAVGPQDVRP